MDERLHVLTGFVIFPIRFCPYLADRRFWATNHQFPPDPTPFCFQGAPAEGAPVEGALAEGALHQARLGTGVSSFTRAWRMDCWFLIPLQPTQFVLISRSYSSLYFVNAVLFADTTKHLPRGPGGCCECNSDYDKTLIGFTLQAPSFAFGLSYHFAEVKSSTAFRTFSLGPGGCCKCKWKWLFESLTSMCG